MKKRLTDIINNMHKYNSSNLCKDMFGFDENIIYDALVIAPGWKATNIIKDGSFNITVLAEHSYICGFLLEKDNLKIAWIQCSPGASNLIDHLSVCAEINFKKLIFVGAVGSLSTDYNVGDLCTPSYSISGVFANAYLGDRLSDYKPFEKIYPDNNYINRIIDLAKKSNYELKKASVFCTDSIALEYSHLDEIKSFNTALIEMETSSFYLLADLFEIPAIALLAVSDNSSAGDPLVGRNDELNKKYHYCRNTVIPDLIYKIAKSE
ncbi:MAG: hypothetical protein J1E36_06770 [Eubacterium sp.]|nr:hypothetical protein [Eubacterium sp.]